jgi:hypothetical protein
VATWRPSSARSPSTARSSKGLRATARSNGYEGSLSRFVNDAVAKETRLQGLAHLLAEWETEFGPITDEQRAQIDRELDDPR